MAKPAATTFCVLLSVVVVVSVDFPFSGERFWRSETKGSRQRDGLCHLISKLRSQ